MNTETEKLKDQIELLHLQILDLNESRAGIHDLLETREHQINQLTQTLDECRTVRMEQSAAVARCTAMEIELRQLKEKYDAYYKNFKRLSEENAKTTEYKNQAEHLARQTIRLTEECNTLKNSLKQTKTELETLKSQTNNQEVEYYRKLPQLENKKIEYYRQLNSLLYNGTIELLHAPWYKNRFLMVRKLINQYYDYCTTHCP